MASNASLYGIPRPKSKPSKEISSSSTIAFTSQLSSLLAQTPSKNAATSAARTRPSKTKPSIFTSHNKNTKKRALADISQDDSPVSQKHSTSLSDTIDSATLQRSKRKLEEKARLYSNMKRGIYIPPNTSKAEKLDSNLLVDFDRKWAEDVEAGRPTDPDSDTNSDSSDVSSSALDIIEYEDELGRTRRGTRAEATRLQRRLAARTHAAAELSQMAARPTAPSSLIHGDVIQAAAFNPDTAVTVQMEELARKRDRSMTPPEAVHYDPKSEVRSKGVGFYAFSRDEEGRKREMDNFDEMRENTETQRREREEQAEKKKKAMEEREKVVAEKRDRKLADAFLESLDGV